MDLFDQEDSSAMFSECGKYRYLLWRIWDKSKPMVMFIGLNPSKAGVLNNDPTITRVMQIASNLGYGGVYMANCFPYISTDPDQLLEYGNTAHNDHVLYQTAEMCQDVIFAWGNFKIVKLKGRDVELTGMFPNAKALIKNKNGSPRHPLYVRANVTPVSFA